MTVSIGSRIAHDAGVVSKADAHIAATQTTAAPDMQISKADGLRGALGLYQVLIDGRTQYMTKDELEQLPRFATAAADSAAATRPTGSIIKAENDAINGVLAKI